MPSLKKRFPFYSKALRLYPKTYQRQYSNQILQTMADLLDNEGINASTRIKIWLRALLDLTKTIPLENLRAVNPKTFVPRALIASILLIIPLICVLSFSFFANTRTLSGDGVINRVIGSTMILWLFIFPIAATIISILGIVVWNMNKQKNTNAKEYSVRLKLVGLTLISLACITFLTFIFSSWIIAGNQIKKSNNISVKYQQNNPTLACKLMPEKDAKAIAGDKIYLDNTALSGSNYSGILTDDKDVQATQCQYLDGNLIGIFAGARSPKNNEATEKLRNDFINNVQAGEMQISLQGHSGYYMYNLMKFKSTDSTEKGSFYLRLWVNRHWLEVTAPNFEIADKAMTVMVSNLENQINATKQAANDKLPNNIDDLTRAERMAITQAVQNQEPTIIAGTSYSVNIDGISGKQITGTFSYATGLHGTFAVEKKQNQWQVVNYQKS